MILESLNALFTRDLNKLKEEIGLYQDEKNMWFIDKNISNSAGNLCLHLIGNLNWFIGATLGHTGYIRNRDLEFSLKNVAREELLKKINETLEVVNSTLNNLPEEALKEEYPILVFQQKTTTEYFIIHLATHLTYHLGQINYHRRLVDTK